MTTSDKGKDAIKAFEGLRLKAYRCSAGIPTIGYGHTKGVKMGMKISRSMAEALLEEDLEIIERQLNRQGLQLNQNQFDALVSWIFNLGISKFNSSTMKKYLINGLPDEEVTDQMVRWVFVGKYPILGLKRRRVIEANLYLGYERYGIDNNNNICKL